MEREQAYELVTKFHLLQEERAHSYKIFQEGHKIYLSTGPEYDFVRFRSLVADVTQDFKRISEGIVSIEKELRVQLGQTALADYVASVQDAEKKKLQMTAQLQLSLQARQDHPGCREIPQQVADLKGKLRQQQEHINNILQKIRYESRDLLI